MSSPEHENNRFWLFRDKFVIVQAVLNIIVHKGLKNQRAFGYVKIVFFLTTLVITHQSTHVRSIIFYLSAYERKTSTMQLSVSAYCNIFFFIIFYATCR